MNENQAGFDSTTEAERSIRAVVDGVRARWRRLIWLRGATRVTATLAAVLVVAILAGLASARLPGTLALVGPIAALLAAVGAWFVTRGLNANPSDRQIARFIEEHDEALDDRFASAVDMLATSLDSSHISQALVADVARRASVLDVSGIVSSDALRRAGISAAAAVISFAIVAVLGRDVARDMFVATTGAFTSPTEGSETAAAEAPVTPRVQRVDVEYTYPDALGLAPRVDEDSGDIFAPAGTHVRLRVHTDGEPASGQMVLASGQAVPLAQEGRTLSGSLDVVADGSYRIGLVARSGESHQGDTEYFIRVLDDRPPNVRILRPARDREVTRLEEVDVQVQARDDFGLERLELVYSVAGGPERAVRFPVPPDATEATGTRTLYLEDLGVTPGDFIAYYVRARDRAAGRASRESRSDIFFLQVRPFNQQFTLAQSQAGGGGGPNRSIDDLVEAQKEIIVATWKLDRRAEAAGATSAAQDIRAVARAEDEIKARVEAASSGLRISTLRDPRRPALPGAGAPPPAEEDAMTAAALALGRAVTALDTLDTGRAIPPEMEALTHLLRAQGEAGERQITQQAGGAGGSNRGGQDLSGLFDRELQRRQQTTYESRQSAERPEDDQSALDEIRELARRQDELQRRQEELARESDRMAAEAAKRELERLTREQAALREQAEELARQMAQREQGSQAQSGRGGQGGQSGRGNQGQTSSQMRQAAEEMARAASELRREDAAQAAARGGRALQQLRQLERQMEQAQPDERRRALGEMELEAQQIADAERRLAEDLSHAGTGQAGEDAKRRLAAEQQRLAERASQLQSALERQAGNGPGQGDPEAAREMQDAARDAAREMAQGRLTERMRQGASEEIARAFDRIGDRLADGRAAGDDDARRLTSQLTRTEAARERIESLSRQLEQLDAQARQGTPAGDGQLAGLRDELARQVQEARELLNELQRNDANGGRGGVGFTFEGQGMVFAEPGTEAFKQDFARWESLRREIAQALETAGGSIAARLNARTSRERLTSGGGDRPPAQYESQTDQYFRAIAAGRQP